MQTNINELQKNPTALAM